MADAVRGALSKITRQEQDAETDNSLAPTGNKSNITSPVKDLGVVGRGTKRIKLEPVSAEPARAEDLGATGRGERKGNGEPEAQPGRGPEGRPIWATQLSGSDNRVQYGFSHEI